MSELKWTYEKCYEEAKKYKNRSELETKNSYVYNKALKNGWLKDYIWFPKKKFWTKEEVFEIGRKYQSKIQFKRNEPKAYDAALQHKWITEMDWFIPDVLLNKDINAKDYSVYEYLDEDIKAVYVGLTNSVKNRNYDHLSKTDKVFLFFKNLGREVPKIKIIKSDLTALESQYYEHLYTNQYKKQGYTLINTGTTGVLSASLGGGFERYTYEYVKEVSQKYQTKKEFMKNDFNSYRKARKKKWLKDFIWLENDGKHFWTYEECYNVAKQYKYKIDFQTYDKAAFTSAYHHGWNKDYIWLKDKNNKWTKENCIKESKKYNSIEEFRSKSICAYLAAKRMDILNHLFDNNGDK